MADTANPSFGGSVNCYGYQVKEALALRLLPMACWRNELKLARCPRLHASVLATAQRKQPGIADRQQSRKGVAATLVATHNRPIVYRAGVPAASNATDGPTRSQESLTETSFYGVALHERC